MPLTERSRQVEPVGWLGAGGPDPELAPDADVRLGPGQARAYTPLFVIGCPRSGTTWVQLLLAQHPAVATAPETQIFAYYLDHFLRQWRHEHETPREQGKAGLSRLLSQEEFDDLCRANASIVLDKIAARNPAARIVMEKSPKHALQAEFIHRILPHARFLHVVRDPRDTTASLLAASRTWARGWAPRNPVDAARMWKSHVLAARALSGSPRYREIHYEALTRNTAEELRATFDWLGIPLDLATCERAALDCSLDRLKKVEDGSALPIPAERSPRDFFRKGVAGGWSHDLSRGQVRVIEEICGDLLRGAGYAPATGGGVLARLRILAHDAVVRAREAVDWQLQRLSWKI